MLENVKGVIWGERVSCFEVRVASSNATRSPKAVTISAASFIRGGMVMSGVFRGSILEVINRPAIMLPQAKRLIGLITSATFSLIGGNELKRG